MRPYILYHQAYLDHKLQKYLALHRYYFFHPSKKMDYLLKLLKYRFAGVKEYWIVDPEKNRVIVYNFTGDESVNDYTLQDFVKVGIYEDFVIDFGSMEL